MISAQQNYSALKGNRQNAFVVLVVFLTVHTLQSNLTIPRFHSILNNLPRIPSRKLMVITTICPFHASTLPSYALPDPVSYESPCTNTRTGSKVAPLGVMFTRSFMSAQRNGSTLSIIMYPKHTNNIIK